LRRKGQTPAARELLNRVIETASVQRAGSTDSPERWALLEARALNWLCSFDTVEANYEAVQRDVARELDLSRSFDMRRVIAVALMDRISLALVMGDWETLRHALDESMRSSKQVGSLNGLANVLRMKGCLARHDGDYDAALANLAKSRAQYMDAGDAVGEVYTWLEESLLRVLLGDFASASHQLDTAERSLNELGRPAVEMLLLQNARSWLAHHAGDTLQALASAEMACLMAQLLDMPLHLGDALVLAGLAQESAGHAIEAWQSFASAFSIFDRLALHYRSLEPRAGLARLALAQGDVTAAGTHVAEAMAALHSKPIPPDPPLPIRGSEVGDREAIYRTRTWGGADEPFRIMETCYRVLQAAGDPRGADVLKQAQATLDYYAGHIADAQMRQSFLERVPLHRDIAAVVITR
jgi:tetratricopeptide (TPR) repeat protein